MRRKLTEEEIIERQEKRAEKNAKKVFELFGFEIWYSPLSWTVREKGNIFYFPSFRRSLEEIADTRSDRKIAKAKNLEEAISFLKERDETFLRELREALKGKIFKSEHYPDTDPNHT